MAIGYKSKPYLMRTRVASPPAVFPVTVGEVKTHLRILSNTEDAYLDTLIAVGTQLLEEFLHRKLISQGLEGWLDAQNLMSAWWPGTIVASITAIQSLRVIELPWSPTISVTSVSLFGIDDTEYAVNANTYRVDTVDKSLPARITLKESSIWPGGSYRNQNSLKVIWVSGYGPTAGDVPAALRQALLMMVAFLFNNRGDCSGDCVGACGATYLAQPFRIYNL